MTSKILFDHLPKAGGTSVLRFLQAATGQRVPHIRGGAVTVRYRLKTLDAVAGHFTGRVLPGLNWSSQHLDGGGCDGAWAAAFGSVRTRRVAVPRPALGGAA